MGQRHSNVVKPQPTILVAPGYPSDRAMYDLIHGTQFTVDLTTVSENCNSLKSTLIAQGRKIDSICIGEHIFMIILMEFLNQSIMLGRVQSDHLQIVVDTFDMHKLLLTQTVNSVSIMTHYDTDAYGTIIPQYTFSREDYFIRCKGKLFIDMLHELPQAMGNYVLELIHNSFTHELTRCIRVPSASPDF